LTLTSNENPLAVSVEAFEHTLAVNTTSAYASMVEAVDSFKSLGGSGVFIYTGNILNKFAMPAYADLGAGKSAMAHWIEVAAKAYGGKGMK